VLDRGLQKDAPDPSLSHLCVFVSDMTTPMHQNYKLKTKSRGIPPFQSETYDYVISPFRNYSATITKQSDKRVMKTQEAMENFVFPDDR